ncbi:MAG: exodeoxyribonuclease VII small subunit [Planctomycetaceae bacterium]|jgi:exodeoxyribonuclease VII small subunit|nr:exodeoxyribonuclease VII small subunit [Planctomycetaceae bacterium]
MELTFEESLDRLEVIIGRLDNDNSSLNDALTDYEEAVGILKRCHDMLSMAERKIEILRIKKDKKEIEIANESDYRSNLTDET